MGENSGPAEPPSSSNPEVCWRQCQAVADVGRWMAYALHGGGRGQAGLLNKIAFQDRKASTWTSACGSVNEDGKTWGLSHRAREVGGDDLSNRPRTEMELDRRTRRGLLFLSGLSPTGCAGERLMTRSMISGVSAFAHPVGARFVNPRFEAAGCSAKIPGARSGSLSR